MTNEQIISNLDYILDTLIAYRNISNTVCCNDCGKAKGREYAPKPGELVRYNCPFYQRKEGEG